MRWDEFEAAAPVLAGIGRDLFEAQHLATLGTLRADGGPRISPCEIYFVDGELMLGMMPSSRKALDLRRDSRITVVSGQEQRAPAHGDFKIYGRATEVFDQPRRDRLADEQEAVIDWRPSDPFHVFAVDIESATYISYGEGRQLLYWTAEGGMQPRRHPDD
jgi:hypothetical protein